MGKLFVLMCMIFMHILDDFCLQPIGFLANGKQKEWWMKNAPDEKYKYDYLVVLFFHSFSWTFMMMMPLLLHLVLFGGAYYPLLFIGNVIIHFYVDNEKANNKKFNLVQDQACHMIQILVTWLLWFYIY